MTAQDARLDPLTRLGVIARLWHRAARRGTSPQLRHPAAEAVGGAIDPVVYELMVFVMAIFVGYYVVWSVTPALHTPLMA